MNASPAQKHNVVSTVSSQGSTSCQCCMGWKLIEGQGSSEAMRCSRWGRQAAYMLHHPSQLKPDDGALFHVTADQMIKQSAATGTDAWYGAAGRKGSTRKLTVSSGSIVDSSADLPSVTTS